MDSSKVLGIYILIADLVCAAQGACNENVCSRVDHRCSDHVTHVQCLLDEIEECSSLQITEKSALQETINIQAPIRDSDCNSAGTATLSIFLSLLAFAAFHVFK